MRRTLTAVALALLAPAEAVPAPERTAGSVMALNEAPVSVLGVTETTCNLPEPNRRMLLGLSKKCDGNPSLSVMINLFDAPLQPQDHPENDLAEETKLLPPDLSAACGKDLSALPEMPNCVVGLTRVRGFKMRYFKHVLHPSMVQSYEYVWAFDNDIDAGDDVEHYGAFRISDAVEIMRAGRILIAQPLVRKYTTMPFASEAAAIAEANAHLVDAVDKQRRLDELDLSGENFKSLTTPLQPAGCQAQEVQWTECQTPIFAREAWKVLHAKVLTSFPEEIAMTTDQGPATLWCHLMSVELKDKGTPCAVLSTIVTVHDADTIHKVKPSFYELNQKNLTFSFMQKTFPDYYPCAAPYDAGECARQRHSLPRGQCLLMGESEPASQALGPRPIAQLKGRDLLDVVGDGPAMAQAKAA